MASFSDERSNVSSILPTIGIPQGRERMRQDARPRRRRGVRRAEAAGDTPLRRTFELADADRNERLSTDEATAVEPAFADRRYSSGNERHFRCNRRSPKKAAARQSGCSAAQRSGSGERARLSEGVRGYRPPDPLIRYRANDSSTSRSAWRQRRAQLAVCQKESHAEPGQPRLCSG
jgi:hypothetical protein